MNAQKLDDDGLLLRLALLTRRLGRFPTESHLRLERRQDPSFPSSNTFSDRFGRKAAQVARLRQFAETTEGFSDILTIVPDESAASVDVYLGLQLPERPNQIHYLKTDDPVGIEKYWLERFKKAGRHTNGEWFELSREDVATFKRRGRFI